MSQIFAHANGNVFVLTKQNELGKQRGSFQMDTSLLSGYLAQRFYSFRKKIKTLEL